MKNELFVVTTQALENYGAHAESGKFRDGNAYWKFKSGTDYLVEGLDRAQDAMAFVAAIGMENGIGWKEFPAEVMTFEEWDRQWDRKDTQDQEFRKFKIEHFKRVSPQEVL